jgi:hypothetical protein
MKSEAVKFGQEVAELVKEIDPGARFQVFTGMFGSVERIYWIADFAGLVELEQTLHKIEADPRWHDFVSKSPTDIFVQGSGEENVIQLVQ